jgi:hypothetical protein
MGSANPLDLTLGERTKFSTLNMSSVVFALCYKSEPHLHYTVKKMEQVAQNYMLTNNVEKLNLKLTSVSLKQFF